MRTSIFRDAKDNQEKSDRHEAIHQTWKKKVLLPLLQYLMKKKISRKLLMFVWKFLKKPMVWILRKKIKKYMVKGIEDIPDEPFNKNFRILYDSFEKGIEDWYYNFYQGIKNGKIDKEKYAELKKKFDKTNHWYEMPKFFLDLLMTVILEDTAYRELVNIILFRLQGEMNKHYNPKVKHKFPMYICMYESYLLYFIEWMKIRGGGKIQLNVTPEGLPTIDTRGEKKYFRFKMSPKTIKNLKKLTRKQRPKFDEELDRFLQRMLS